MGFWELGKSLIDWTIIFGVLFMIGVLTKGK
jgi:hypothetical protein